MITIVRKSRNSVFVLSSLLCLLLFLFAACSSGSTNSATPTAGHAATPTSGSSKATATPVINLGTQPCPDAVKSLAHWDALIGTQSGVSQVGQVTCGNLIGQPTLQALIVVDYAGTGHVVDVYVYNNITAAAPQQIFKLQNLYMGEAKISGYNTLLSGEVDQGSSVNRGKSNAAYTVDLFREFKWSDGVGTLVQVSFPGIYPDLTRYQAENDQAQVNQGHNGWKLSAAQVANNMAVSLLGWSNSSTATIVSGGGGSDADAVVNVRSANVGAGTITVTMSRLESNTNGGIWIVTDVASKGFTITSPVERDSIRSPVIITGTGTAFEGVIGTVEVLDHLYNNIGHASAKVSSGSDGFSTSVTYTTSFHGVQEGLVVLLAENNAGGPARAVVMEKELVGG
ncbi:MAG TPA: hypothetical protein VNG51_00160 [Ktedonobacteraceae bacterium]|nr:hypothetical protein [Ktedonobacteraceae bacterium]